MAIKISDGTISGGRVGMSISGDVDAEITRVDIGQTDTAYLIRSEKVALAEILTKAAADGADVDALRKLAEPTLKASGTTFDRFLAGANSAAAVASAVAAYLIKQ